MQLLHAVAILSLVYFAIGTAIPTSKGPKLGKRSVTFQRVAAGWRARDVLHFKVEAMQKFGIEMSASLKAAHAKNRVQAKLRIKHRKGNGKDSQKAGNGIMSGVQTITVTVTAVPAISTEQPTRSAGSDRNRTEHGTSNGGPDNTSNSASARGTVTSAAQPASTGISTGGSTTGNGTKARGQTGVVANMPEPGDVEFLSEISIGGQKIVMNFDTGSSDLWVFSTNLNAQSQTGHTVYDPSKSTTFKAADPTLQNRFAIRFGDGSSASGSKPNAIGTDVVDIGGAVARTQTIELADTVSGTFIRDTASNGLVGLGFSKINTIKPKAAKTFFDTIAEDLDQPILAADLRPGAPGSYSFGEINTQAFIGQLTEIPIDNSQGFWQFQSSTFSVGNNGQIQRNGQNSPAIADTGTTLMLVDDDIVQGYYSQVQGAQLDNQAGLFVYPCSSRLPDLSIAVGANYNAVIPGKLLNFQALDTAGTSCAGALQSNNGAGIQIYGDIFFKAQYTVFNIRNNTISLAPHS